MANYNKINWQNNATTPLNATNLNKMDDAIYGLYRGNTAYQQAIVDPINGNDSTGMFNDSTKPFRTLGFLFDQLHAGTYTEIFIQGNANIGGKQYRLQGAEVVIMAYGEGVPDPSLDTSKITFTDGFSLHLSSGAGLSMYIDVDANYGTSLGANGVFNVGASCNVEFAQHRVHDFTNSISNDNYVKNGRTANLVLGSNVAYPMSVLYSSFASIGFSSVAIDDSAVTGTPVFVLISGNTPGGVKLSPNITINGTSAGLAQLIADRMSGLIRYADGKPANVLFGGLDMSTSTGGA